MLILRVLVLWLVMFHPGMAADEEDLKRDAVQRLVGAHDPAIFVATGALYLKQEAVRTAPGRTLTAAQEARVDRIIDETVRNPEWFRVGWGNAIDKYLSAEEADEIATHFTSPGGMLQRRVIELAIGEVLMTNYTFTDRIDHRLPASAAELRQLQRVVDERQFHGVQDFSAYPDVVKFASSGAGVKYMKMLMIQGVEAMTAHFEGVAKQVREVARSDAADRPKQ